MKKHRPAPVSIDYILWLGSAPNVAKPIRPNAKNVKRRIGSIAAFSARRHEDATKRMKQVPAPVVRAKRESKRYTCAGKLITW